jgi:hypothetical protein
VTDKVWIDTKRGEEAKNHLCRMVKLNLMEEEFRAVGRWSVRVPFSLPDSVRWIVRSIKRRRGHRSVRKHDVRMLA